jgi:hypothetical protein
MVIPREPEDGYGDATRNRNVAGFLASLKNNSSEVFSPKVETRAASKRALTIATMGKLRGPESLGQI